MVTATRRNGLCPCCQETRVCTDAGRLFGAEYDHYFARNQNRVTQTWLVCGPCNEALIGTDFKVAARSAFESCQAAVRPLLNRQMAFAVMTAPGERRNEDDQGRSTTEYPVRSHSCRGRLEGLLGIKSRRQIKTDGRSRKIPTGRGPGSQETNSVVSCPTYKPGHAVSSEIWHSN
jgi:hypothetical protein